MKNNLIKPLLFTLAFISGFCKAQSWQWVNQEQFSGESYDACIDASGNLYHAVTYNANATTGTINLIANASNNAAIIKYNPAGQAVWAATYSLSGVLGLCLDNAGNLFATGVYNGTLVAGTTTLTQINNATTGDIFIIKFDGSGNVLWAKGFGGSGFDAGYAVCSDSQGNCIITGYTYSSLLTINSSTIVASGNSDYLVCKFDSNGNYLWGQASNGGVAAGHAVSTNSLGDIFFGGTFGINTSTTLVIGTNTLNSVAFTDVFVAKLNSSGQVQWVKTASGPGFEKLYSLECDAAGNAYAAGYFSGANMVLNSTTTISSQGGADAFLVKYDGTNGNPIWYKSFGSPAIEYGLNTVCYNGGLYMAGGFTGNTLTIGSTTLNSPYTYDNSFYVQMDDNGTILNTFYIGVGGDDWLNIALDKNCNLLIAGDSYNNNVVVGSFTLTHSATEAPVILKYNIGSPPTISIATSSLLCNNLSTTLTGAGATTYSWSNGATTNSLVLPPGQAGTYSVTGTSSLGCTGSATQNIVLLPAPTISITNNRPLLCVGQSATLSVTGAATYTWNTLANSSTLAVAPPATVIYTVTGKAANGCTATGSMQVKVSECTAVEENNKGTEIQLYPNPAQATLYIEIKRSAANFQLYNALGETIQSLILNEGKNELQLNGGKGLYYFSIQATNQTLKAGKLVIE